MSTRPVRFLFVLLGLAVISAAAAATASAGPLLGRWEGTSAKGATVAFLLGEYNGETLIADAAVMCPPGSDLENGVLARASYLDHYLGGRNDSTWRTLQPVNDGFIDGSNELSWYSGKSGQTGVDQSSTPVIEKGALGHSTGVITKFEAPGLPCKVGRVKVHHNDRPPRPDGSYPLVALPAGTGEVRVTAGGAFVSVEANPVIPSVDPEFPAPCFPFYSTEPLETHGDGDAFAIVFDKSSLAFPENEAGITGTFTGEGTITGGILGKFLLFGGPECAVVVSFIAKAPKEAVRPRLDLHGAARGGQAN